MRLRLILPAIVWLASAAGQPAAAPGTVIEAGPLYTRGAEASPAPRFPDLDIQVELPPVGASPLVVADAFTLKVDGRAPVTATSVRTLKESGYGIALAVALDVSGSMKGAPLDAVRSSLMRFAYASSPEDAVAIETIADEGRWDANWGDRPDRIAAALDHLTTRGRLTRLWDALLDAVHRFPDSPAARRMIVISDGHDEGSAHSEDEVIAAARARGIRIDAVGVTRSDPVYLRSLMRLAGETGGQFRPAHNAAELRTLVSDGIDRLRSIPVVRFHLSGVPGDGHVHHFEVIWSYSGQQFSSAVDASVPLFAAPVQRRQSWIYWVAALTGVLLLMLGFWIFHRAHARAAAARAAAAAAEAPTEAPPPPAIPNFVPAVRAEAAPVSPPRKREPELRREAAQPRRLGGEAQLPAAPARARTIMRAVFPPPTDGHPGAWLFCEEGFAPGSRFPVDQLEYWIGSLENNHLHIVGDPTVSANHACLVFDHDVLGLYDNRSTNGTRVNGERVGEQRHLLRLGDRIRIGRTTLVLQPAQGSEASA
jgi:Mg-chelatase subunit ChlD